MIETPAGARGVTALAEAGTKQLVGQAFQPVFGARTAWKGCATTMGKRSVHYEAAFESYVQAKGWPYVVVDEAKKSVFASVAIKSFDFLVYSDISPNLLVDVKGRKFPDTPGRGRASSRAWENWVTRDDVESLLEWQNIFGTDFQAVLVFAYWLQGPPARAPFEDVHFHRNRYYAFVSIPMAEYAAACRPRSARWQTLSMPAADFAERARDLGDLLDAPTRISAHGTLQADRPGV